MLVIIFFIVSRHVVENSVYWSNMRVGLLSITYGCGKDPNEQRKGPNLQRQSWPLTQYCRNIYRHIGICLLFGWSVMLCIKVRIQWRMLTPSPWLSHIHIHQARSNTCTQSTAQLRRKQPEMLIKSDTMNELGQCVLIFKRF